MLIHVNTRLPGDDYSAANLWDDGILDQARTLDALGLAISASLYASIAERERGFGTFRI
ncbi:MAG: hypothetical protein HYX75_08250 [Acidobacteria bacterium]|nr:hypothetical protein [Acidobacteriota bacterium]